MDVSLIRTDSATVLRYSFTNQRITIFKLSLLKRKLKGSSAFKIAYSVKINLTTKEQNELAN